MSVTVNRFLTMALTEIRSARGGDVVNPDDMDVALFIFNELLDALNADGRALYSNRFTTFPLTPNLQPHTIGLATAIPAPTFSVSVGRPVEILTANIILTGNIRVPLDILDDDQWNEISAGAAAGQAVTITASVPRYLSYSSDWPNGSLYLWPVPSTAYGLELQTKTLLAQVALADDFDLPMGYQQALRLTTAELCAPAFGQKVSQTTVIKAQEARARVWANNDEIPVVCTRDGGMPGGMSGRSGYDYRTGLIR